VKSRRLIFEPIVPALIACALLGLDAFMNESSLIQWTRSAVLGDEPGAISSPFASQPSATTAITPLESTASVPDESSVTPSPIPNVANPAGSDEARDPWEIVIDPRDLFQRPTSSGRLPPIFPEESPLRAAPPRADPELQPEDNDVYRIRPGDMAEVFVWGQDNLSSRMRVARDGTVVVKLAGSVRIADLTVDQAAARIATRLKRYLIEPAVTVTITEPGGKDVVVVGEVDAPGPFTIDRPTRLLDVLILAKVGRDRADLSNVTVARDSRTLSLDIASVLRGMRIDQNILVEPGDLIIVPGREQTVSVLGAVTKPGKYSFSMARTLRVRDILLETTMWTTKADIARAFILRGDGSIERVNINALWFQGDAREDKVLRTNDSLVMPELTEIGVYVLGKVGSPGLHTRSGQFTLMQALTLANPSTFNARLYDVRIVRGWPENPEVHRRSVKALLEGDLTQNMMLQPGDVVFVPEGILSYTLEFWNRLLSPIAGTASTIRTVGDAMDSN
jgi:polysaccharide export outer membrane protein